MNISRQSFETDVSEDEYTDDPCCHLNTPSSPATANYGDFLSRANKLIAKDQCHVGDPFLAGTAAPPRPFSRVFRRVHGFNH